MHKREHKVAAIEDIVKSYHSAIAQSILYTDNNLEKVLSEYLKSYKPEAPVKFNFIANKGIIRFIKDGAKKSDKSMSEYLRDIITKQFLR